MKKIIAVVMMVCFLSVFVGCGDDKVIKGKLYETYGLLSDDDAKDPNVKYSLIVGNVVWGVLLAETIIAPIYFFGFSIKEPDCLISECR